MRSHARELSDMGGACKGAKIVGTCHTGYRPCFYQGIDGDVVGEKVFEPDEVY